MLSNAAQYAIRSILYLALYSNATQRVRAKKISQDLEVPQPFLAKLLQRLGGADLVSSSKGPTGGFYLNKANRNKTVWDIIVTVDGTEKFNQCFLGLHTCSDTNPCPVHFSVSPFKQAIKKDFKGKTVAQFAEEIKKRGTVLSLKDFDASHE